MIEKLLEHCPNLKLIIENKTSEPTDKERIEALECAMADLIIQTMGVDTDA